MMQSPLSQHPQLPALRTHLEAEEDEAADGIGSERGPPITINELVQVSYRLGYLPFCLWCDTASAFMASMQLKLLSQSHSDSNRPFPSVDQLMIWYSGFMCVGVLVVNVWDKRFPESLINMSNNALLFVLSLSVDWWRVNGKCNGTNLFSKTYHVMKWVWSGITNYYNEVFLNFWFRREIYTALCLWFLIEYFNRAESVPTGGTALFLPEACWSASTDQRGEATGSSGLADVEDGCYGNLVSLNCWQLGEGCCSLCYCGCLVENKEEHQEKCLGLALWLTV